MKTLFNSQILDEFKEATLSLTNPALEEWKKNGGKIIGCMYHYIPEELITAAGMMPYRMRATGSKGTEYAEADFSLINCSFVRHLFDAGVRGELGFLDGIVSANHCDHLRRFFENWERKVKTPYMHFMPFPKKRGVEQADLFKTKLNDFKESLEIAFGVSITDEKLRDAIKLHNETRALQRELYTFRNNPSISGADVHSIMVAASTMPKEVYNQKLKQLLNELKAAPEIKGEFARIMVVGGELDNPSFIEIIESQGSVVISDSLGYGYRACATDVQEAGDPLQNLANYHVLERPACPRLFGTTFERNALVKDIAKSSHVDGVISVRLPQCDEWSFEQVNLIKYLKNEGIPHMALDIDYTVSSVGQIRTRAQAFIETLH